MEERMKRNNIVPILYALLGMLHFVALPSEANDDIKQRTLKLQPKADTDGDGVLSDVEKLRLLERGEARRKQKTNAGRSSVSSPMTYNSTASGLIKAKALQSHGISEEQLDSLADIMSQAVKDLSLIHI